jgi:hypothetical protein
MMKTKAFRVLLTAGMAVVSTCVVSAQSTMTLPTVGLLGEFTKKTLVGSWVETVHFNNGRPDLKSLVSFHADGTMMSSDQGSVTLGPTPHQGYPAPELVLGPNWTGILSHIRITPITGTVSNSGERISVEVRHAQP